MYLSIEKRAEELMGINLSFCPLPMHLIIPSLLFISEIFNSTNYTGGAISVFSGDEAGSGSASQSVYKNSGGTVWVALPGGAGDDAFLDSRRAQLRHDLLCQQSQAG